MIMLMTSARESNGRRAGELGERKQTRQSTIRDNLQSLRNAPNCAQKSEKSKKLSCHRRMHDNGHHSELAEKPSKVFSGRLVTVWNNPESNIIDLAILNA